jgi:flagellar protein FlaG
VNVVQIPSGLKSNKINNSLTTIMQNNEFSLRDDKQIIQVSTQIKSQEIMEQQTKKAIESFNQIFKPTHLEFQLHQDSGRYYVQIVDDKNKQVLKQIPSEEFLQMIVEAKEQLGIVFDKRV